MRVHWNEATYLEERLHMCVLGIVDNFKVNIRKILNGFFLYNIQITSSQSRCLGEGNKFLSIKPG